MATRSAARMRAGLLGLAIVAALALSLGTANSNSASQRGDQSPLLAGSGVPVGVRAVLRRACQDCHSANTNWPWYAHIPPVSIQIHRDVDNARAFLDFSKWNDYSESQRRGLASAINAALGAGLMPPPQYLWIHRGARLSESERKFVQAWALSAARKAPGESK
jgi:hypothetical protein